jgi:hypothetical protein
MEKGNDVHAMEFAWTPFMQWTDDGQAAAVPGAAFRRSVAKADE